MVVGGTESLDAKDSGGDISVQLPYTDKETKAGGAAMLFLQHPPHPTQVKIRAGVHRHGSCSRTAALGCSWRSGLRVSPCSPADISEYYTLIPPGHKWGLWSFLPGCLSTRTSWYPEQIGRRLIAPPYLPSPEHPPGLSPAQPPALLPEP